LSAACGSWALARLCRAAVSAYIDSASVESWLKTDGTGWFSSINAWACHIIVNPALTERVPSPRLRLQMIVAIFWISKERVGVNIAFSGKTTLDITVFHRARRLRYRPHILRLGSDRAQSRYRNEHNYGNRVLDYCDWHVCHSCRPPRPPQLLIHIFFERSV